MGNALIPASLASGDGAQGPFRNIVQGATDTQVTPDQAEELASAIRSGGNRDVTVKIIPETNHLLVHDPDGSFTNYSKLKSFDVNPPVLGTIADWVAARMR